MIIALSLIVSVYLLLSVVVYFYQEKLIFFPESLPKEHQFDFQYPHKEIDIVTKDGVTLNAVFFKQATESKGVILYIHGNAGSNAGWGDVSTDLMRLGYDLLVYDFRSYGKSEGQLTEANLFNDAMTIYKYLRKQYSNDHIVVYGRSLGTGIALNLCKKVNPKQLILETPYLSMKAMAEKTIPWLPVSLILKYPIRSDRFISKVKCPIDIIHGTKDELIPYKQAVKLSRIKSGVGLYTIDGGHHMDLNQFAPFSGIIDEIFKKYEK